MAQFSVIVKIETGILNKNNMPIFFKYIIRIFFLFVFLYSTAFSLDAQQSQTDFEGFSGPTLYGADTFFTSGITTGLSFLHHSEKYLIKGGVEIPVLFNSKMYPSLPLLFNKELEPGIPQFYKKKESSFLYLSEVTLAYRNFKAEFTKKSPDLEPSEMLWGNPFYSTSSPALNRFPSLEYSTENTKAGFYSSGLVQNHLLVFTGSIKPFSQSATYLLKYLQFTPLLWGEQSNDRRKSDIYGGGGAVQSRGVQTGFINSGFTTSASFLHNNLSFFDPGEIDKVTGTPLIKTEKLSYRLTAGVQFLFMRSGVHLNYIHKSPGHPASPFLSSLYPALANEFKPQATPLAQNGVILGIVPGIEPLSHFFWDIEAYPQSPLVSTRLYYKEKWNLTTLQIVLLLQNIQKNSDLNLKSNINSYLSFDLELHLIENTLSLQWITIFSKSDWSSLNTLNLFVLF